jgi:L-asparaginase
MLVLNTGGTFNKRYNPISGVLEVPYDNAAVEAITACFTEPLDLAGVIYKDSLEMSAEDRRMIADIILASSDERFIVVHGTDTMHLSAAFMAELTTHQVVVFTGAMIPFSIDPIEATANLAMAIGFAKTATSPGVYICMQGLVERHDAIVKNRTTGQFERVNREV